MMQGKNVFVSGGAGVIGLELVPKLINYGANVFVGDLKARPKHFDKKIIYRQGDLNKIHSCELELFEPEIFIHLAATFERSEETYEFWDENFSHNVSLSHHLMGVLKDLPSLKRVIFASSYLIYNPDLYQFSNLQELPISLNESDPVMPRNLTGSAKLAHEIELRYLDQFKSDQFSSVCVRIYRGYGKNSRCVISRWIRSLLAGEEINVYRPEGIFDYIYGTDTAEGLIRLAANDNANGVINLGTGNSRKVSDIISILRKYFPDMKVNIISSDIPYEASQANVNKLNSYINWLPEYTLETAIPEIIEHEKEVFYKTNINITPPNVLVSSSSAKTSLIRELVLATRKINIDSKVIAGDIDEKALSFRVADESWQMPSTINSNLQEIISGCLERNIKFILPTRDGELEFWAKNKTEFLKHNINVIVSDIGVINICIDKYNFYKFGLENNIAVIETALDINDISSDLFVVKERFGSGSDSIGIKLDREAAIKHALSLEEPIYQPYINGVEFSADAWLTKDSQCKGVILRWRDIVINGESQVTTTFRNALVEEKVASMTEILKLQGPVVIQGFIDGDNIYIIECNSRFGGASTASIAAGLDSLFWSLVNNMDGSIDKHSFIRISGEVQQLRILNDKYVFNKSF